MKAAQIVAYGGPSAVVINEVPKPSIDKTQVLIQVHASSLNPADSGLRAGDMDSVMPLQFPATLGGDVAGVVVEVGEDVKDFAPGNNVYGQSYCMFGGSGAFAEYAAVNAGQLATMPKNVDFDQAGSLPLVGISALQAVMGSIKLQPGQRVLIHGGAGAVGAIAVQIAKHVGAYVAATAGAQGVATVKALGADEVIDYRAQQFETILHDYDAVVDLVGGETFTKSLRVLKPGGTIVTLVAWMDEAITAAKAQNFNALFQGTDVTTEALDELTELIQSGVVTPPASIAYPLSEIVEAFTAREDGSAGKKVIVTIG